jgi:hypothetical protein
MQAFVLIVGKYIQAFVLIVGKYIQAFVYQINSILFKYLSSCTSVPTVPATLLV